MDNSITTGRQNKLENEVIFSGQKNILYKTWIGYLLSFAFFFILLYPVQFRGTPLTNRVLVGAAFFGIVFGITALLTFIKEIKFKKRAVFFVCLMFLISFVALISVLINGTKDFFYIYYPITTVAIVMLAAYAVVYVIIKTHGYVSFNILATYFIICVTLQCLIGLNIYLNLDIARFFKTLQVYKAAETKTVALSEGVRILGFGAQFMNAGVILGFGLMLLALLIKRIKLKLWQMIGLGVVFGFNFVIGMMMARTTIIGTLLAIGILLFPYSLNKNSLYNGFKFFFLLTAIGVLFYYFGFPLMPEDMVEMFEYGFEMFINFAEVGEFRTDSSDQVIAMYKWPNNFKTWMIGDALFQRGEGKYYMTTDIGYCRLVFYFGIVGLLVYSMFQLSLIYMSFHLNKDKFSFKIFSVVCTLFYFAIMTKGIMEMTYLFGTFWIATNLFRSKYEN